MANVIKITDGTTDIDLYYDTDGFEMLADGNEFGIAEHRNLYHESDYADGSMLVRHNKENKKWTFKLAARGTTNDGTTAILSRLNRLAGQARNYQINGTGSKVYLHIQLDGATKVTYYDIIDIEYDKAGFLDYYNIRQKELVFNDGFSIGVITGPIGYGDRETIQNFIKTPSFQEDANSDGLADNWSESGAPTTSIETTIYLAGSQSQKVVTDTSGTDGIYSDTIACTAYQGQSFVGYVWVYRASGDDITLDVVGDSSGSIDTATYNAATVTTTGKDGSSIFRKLSVSGTIGASDTEITVRIERLTGGASAATTYYVDKCYLQFAASSEPYAWCSCTNICNYIDYTESGKINYLDICDIAGDVSAEPEVIFHTDSGSVWNIVQIATYKRSRVVNRDISPISYMYFFKNEGNAADAARVNSDYKEYAVTSSAYVALAYIRQFGQPGKFVAEAALKLEAGSASTQFDIIALDFISGIYSEPKRVTLSSDRYEIFQTNPINMKQASTDSMYGVLEDYIIFYIKAVTTGNSYVYVDFGMALPIDENYIIAYEPGYISHLYKLHVYTNMHGAGMATVSSSGYEVSWTTQTLGDAIRISTEEEQRMFFMFAGDSSNNKFSHTLSSGNVYLIYRPATEFLL